MTDRIRLNRRRMSQSAAAFAAGGVPMINIGRYAMAGAQARTYSARAVVLVERSLGVDMPATPRIDSRPEPYSEPLSDAAIAEFRACGINAMHNSVGLGSRDEALTFLA